MAEHSVGVDFFPMCTPYIEIRRIYPDNGIVFDVNVNPINAIRTFIKREDVLPFLSRVHDVVEAELVRIAKEYGDAK